MFRRLRSGLPKDPVFAKDLKGLGFFINEKDEIRSIENPKAYFNFFLTKNERYNVVQREGMNEAIRNIVAERLEALGLVKLRLPLGASETDRHVNVFVSEDLKSKKEIIVLFYEASQDLGIFAHRVIGGNGGINVGSAVNFVKYIQESATKDGRETPGIVLANLGQLCWSSRAKKGLTLTSWYALPRKSAADPPYDFDEYKNSIPGNKNTKEHVAYVFNNVLGNPDICDEDSKVQVIGVSDGAVQATWFLHDPENFSKWCKGVKPAVNNGWDDKPAEKFNSVAENVKHAHGEVDEEPKIRVISLASVATSISLAENPEFSNPEFLEITNPKFKTWFANRGRTYALTHEPAGQFLAPSTGHKIHQALGAPTFSLGETHYPERMLVVGYRIILDWCAEVAADPEYANPKLKRIEIEEEDEPESEPTERWGEGEPIQRKTFEYKPSLVENVSEIRVNGVEGVTPMTTKPTFTTILTQPVEISANARAGEKEALEKLNNMFSVLNTGKKMGDKTENQVAEVMDDEDEAPANADLDDDLEAGLSMENVITYGGRTDGYKYDPEVGE